MEMAPRVETQGEVGQEPVAEPHSADPVATVAILAVHGLPAQAAEEVEEGRLGSIGPPTHPAQVISLPWPAEVGGAAELGAEDPVVILTPAVTVAAPLVIMESIEGAATVGAAVLAGVVIRPVVSLAL